MVGGRAVTLHLGMRGLGKLQDEFGQQLEPILGAFEEQRLPHFGAIVRVVEVALERHHPEAGSDLADDIVAEHPQVFAQLLEAAFPDQSSTPAGSGKKRKAAA
ncbi:hypothetical protein Rsph17029_0636 [Rhodobacter sphaeroides ATCC 17029]|nr:hypothetical protein Rsph17029_0636 [Cereibacter sphaeroides ATCC 17029]